MNSTLLCLSLLLTGPGAESADSIVTDEEAVVAVKKQVEVPAREAGVIDELKVKLQDEIELGDLIAHLDRDLAELEEKAAVKDHEIALLESKNLVDREYAEKTTEVSESALTKSLEANDDYPGTVTRTELERLDLEVKRGLLSVKQADHTHGVNLLTERVRFYQLEAAQKRLARRTVKSPLKGMVVKIYKEEGEWVEPRDSIIRIIQLDTLRVNARVDASKYGPELRGCKAELAVLLPGQRREIYDGEVTFVDPELDADNQQLIIQADMKNHNGDLRPGMRGTLTIHVGTMVEKESR